MRTIIIIIVITWDTLFSCLFCEAVLLGGCIQFVLSHDRTSYLCLLVLSCLLYQKPSGLPRAHSRISITTETSLRWNKHLFLPLTEKGFSPVSGDLLPYPLPLPPRSPSLELRCPVKQDLSLPLSRLVPVLVGSHLSNPRVWNHLR